MTSARTLTPTPRTPERLTSLDGLRGVAALVVLIHHSLLTVPFLARAYYEDLPPVPEGSLAWWLTYSPLHLAWAGTEAVFLFFVLSGFVVTLPALRSPGFDWVAFYPRRIVRIYGPVAVAVAFGLAAVLLVPRFNEHALGHWMNQRPNDISVSDVLRDLTLVDGTSGLVSPLWSLQWEILFSAFLPLFVGFALIARRRPKTALGLLLVALAAGSVFTSGALFYMTLFAVGAALVALWDRISAIGARLSRHAWAWPAIVAVALVITSAEWWVQGLGISLHRATLMRWTVVPGVVLLLLAAALWRPAVRLLDTKLLQWLGRISFSLYLVHEPIVTTTRFLLVQVHMPTYVSIAIAIPVAIGVAEVFTRFVELPFHRLARTVGRKVAVLAHEHRTARPQPARPQGVPTSTASITVVRAPERERETVVA